MKTKFLLLPLSIIFLIAFASAASVTVSTFYDSTTGSSLSVMSGDSVGVIVSADSIFESFMDVKLDLINSANIVTNVVNVHTTADSYYNYITIGAASLPVGTYTIRGTVTGASGQTDTSTLSLVVLAPTPGNHAPVIVSTPVTQIDEGAAYSYDVNANDADGDTIVYSLTQAPAWISINSATGVISGTAPQLDSNYEFVATVRASDGKDFDTQTFTITVKNVSLPPVPPSPTNHLPVIVSTPVTSVNEGQNYLYDVNANDADGNTLTYSLTTAPGWLSINSATGVISGTAPSVADNVAYNIIVSVSDGIGSVGQTYTLTVVDVPVVVPPTNNAPVITSTPILTINEGTVYNYQVTASDPEGNALSYLLSLRTQRAPRWLSVNPVTGMVSGTAPLVSADTFFDVIITVSDGTNSVTQRYTLTVIDVPTVPPVVPTTNNLPVITSTIPVTSVNEGQNYLYDVNANDADGNTLTYSLTTAPGWLSINSVTGVISGTAPLVSANTPFAVIVSVSDGIGSVGQSYTLTVIDTSGSSSGGSGGNRAHGGSSSVKVVPQNNDFETQQYLGQFESAKPIVQEETPTTQKVRWSLLKVFLFWLFVLILILAILVIILLLTR